MDCEDMEENGTKTRSLRFQDYYNRRVFLRSYPLHFGAEDEKTIEEKVSATNKDTEKKPIRRMFSAVIHWGEGKVLILRKFKDKLQVTKTRSLRFEDYNNRRVFLAVIHWGEGKVLILRKFKHKLQVYIIACMPISFKPPTALVSI
jgi:hypothetical protein